MWKHFSCYTSRNQNAAPHSLLVLWLHQQPFQRHNIFLVKMANFINFPFKLFKHVYTCAVCGETYNTLQPIRYKFHLGGGSTNFHFY